MESKVFQQKSLFSLIELSIIGGIFILLSAVLTPYIFNVLSLGNRTKCQSNINQLMTATKIYLDTYNEAPVDFEPGLREYAGVNAEFNCPESGVHYENFFFARKTKEKEAYLLGCPMHSGVQVYKNNANESNEICQAGLIRVDGNEFKIVDQFNDLQFFNAATGNRISFEDGSTVDFNNNFVGIIASFRQRKNDKLFTAIRMYKANIPQDIHVKVKKGSDFVIKTPIGVVGVRGTEFDVSTRWGNARRSIIVIVKATSGMVYLEGFDGKSVNIDGRQNESYELEVDIAHAQFDPKLLRRNISSGFGSRPGSGDPGSASPSGIPATGGDPLTPPVEEPTDPNTGSDSDGSSEINSASPSDAVPGPITRPATPTNSPTSTFDTTSSNNASRSGGSGSSATNSTRTTRSGRGGRSSRPSSSRPSSSGGTGNTTATSTTSDTAKSSAQEKKTSSKSKKSDSEEEDAWIKEVRKGTAVAKERKQSTSDWEKAREQQIDYYKKQKETMKNHDSTAKKQLNDAQKQLQKQIEAQRKMIEEYNRQLKNSR